MSIEVRYAGQRLHVDHRPGDGDAHLLAIHGAGDGHLGVFAGVRQALWQRGIGSTAFDCIGHGVTGGVKQGSSLREREAQARAVIEATRRPTAIIGASMGAYNAVRLSETCQPSALVLVVPGIYHADAHAVPFGPAFSALIRQPRSWDGSDAWGILSRYRGRLLVIAAGGDEVVPLEIPRRLYDEAVNAQWRSLLVVPGAPHKGLLERMLGDREWRPRLLERLFHAFD
ncbi:alpha/beta fold hydrolase [Pseudomonas japonica]|uniref:Serine aminopeptidase S33 domain-containing protein n=1 Tax=Pseudomonas japonica TaxID=256466 RepID=A0A239BP37_9PSED|nr:alpha/beta fold hydrolase [Pseudomonas japonica]SNS08804.1 hypothetical protein SAMN05444352_10352 [Pseudomonas japonica]